MVGRTVALSLFFTVYTKLNLKYIQQKYIIYLLPLYPGPLRLIISNANRLNGRVAGNSYCRLQKICCVCFAIKQVLYSILSGAYLVVNLVTFMLLICLGSYLIASGPVQPSILCYFEAVALTSLQAIWLSQYLPVKKVD